MISILDKGPIDTQLSVVLTKTLGTTPVNTYTFASKGDVINTTYPYEAYVNVYSKTNNSK